MVLLFQVKSKWSLRKKKHSIFVCSPFKWSDFLCVLALSSVCLCFAQCYYKSYDVMLKYKVMFNKLIKPGKFPSFNSEAIYLLFCNNNIVPPTPLRQNHHVPLDIGSQKYRKNKKRKLVTSQKYKENKKRATSSKHLSWKWDLSANNHLPNFADYVNAHKSSSECKSSTFNITADIFFSLNKNFLKLRAALSKLLLLTFPILILFLSQHLSINIFLTILLFLVVKLNIV